MIHVCLPRNGGSRKGRDTHNDEARDDRTWGAGGSVLYAGTLCSRPASWQVLSCLLPWFLGEVGGCRYAHDSLDSRWRRVLDADAETKSRCKQTISSRYQLDACLAY